MARDSDPFNQWDAAQQIAIRVMLDLLDAGQLYPSEMLEALLLAFGHILQSRSVDDSLIAEMLQLPGEKYLAEMCQPADIQAIHQVREFVKEQLAQRYESELLELYQACDEEGEYSLSSRAMGKRALRNTCLAYLTLTGQAQYFELAEQQFDAASNMTDQMAGLMAVVHYRNEYKDRMFEAFYQQWSDTPLVVDKWFSALASSHAPDALDDILKLEKHKAFNLVNPNRARSLIGSLQANAVVFHDSSGKGYEYLADKILELDGINPQIASRMASAFLNWKKLIPELGEKMKEQILRIQSKPGLSNDVAELMSSCLADSS